MQRARCRPSKSAAWAKEAATLQFMNGPQSEKSQHELNVRRFNESFYASDPADYLLTRLQLLMLAGGKRPELAALIETGVEYAGMTLGTRAPSDTASAADSSSAQESPDDDEGEFDNFLIVESQTLQPARRSVKQQSVVLEDATPRRWRRHQSKAR